MPYPTMAYAKTNSWFVHLVLRLFLDLNSVIVCLQAKFPTETAKVGFSKAMANGWIEVNKKAENGPRVQKKAKTIEDEVQGLLGKIRSLNLDEVKDKSLQDLKKRKLIAEQ